MNRNSQNEFLHVGRPNIGDKARLFARVQGILDRRWLTNDGPLVREFEQRICDIVGVKHCVAMCNATVALEICIRALELKGEVIVPSFTFVATAHALQWQEITPVFCDVDPLSHNLDPRCIERLITPRTSGIIGVHVWGNSCNVAAIEDIAKRHRLKVMYDAAHAFGCSRQGRMLGNFGAAEVFSFHATKFINSGEGGAVVTNDDQLAEKMRLMRNFGFAGYDNVIYLGTNGKMNELSAAMGLTSLDSINEFVACNRANYVAYREALAEIPGLRMFAYDEAEQNNYQYVVVEVAADEFGLTRNELVRLLHENNVIARRYFYPGCHRMEPYRSYYPNAGLLLPQTESLCERVLELPTGTAVTEDDVQFVSGIIRNAHASSSTQQRS